jgi:hypothetical protein
MVSSFAIKKTNAAAQPQCYTQKKDVQVILLFTANRRLHKALTYCSVDYSVDYSGESED